MKYVRLWMPYHPNAHKQGYILEHIFIASVVLGKPLPPNVVIHHIDNNPKNNKHNNLVICQNNDYHSFIHQRANALKYGGNKYMRKCIHCKQYDYPCNLSIFGNTIYHKSCEKKKGYERRRKAGMSIRQYKEKTK